MISIPFYTVEFYSVKCYTVKIYTITFYMVVIYGNFSYGLLFIRATLYTGHFLYRSFLIQFFLYFSVDTLTNPGQDNPGPWIERHTLPNNTGNLCNLTYLLTYLS
jgi:hypothetical protein